MNEKLLEAEYRLKAAFLYNFGKFVTWPEDGEIEEMVLGVWNPRPFGGILQTMSDKRIRGRPIRVITVSSAEEARQCHILFLNAPRKVAEAVLAELQNAPILTVGEYHEFGNNGGLLSFFPEKGRVRFKLYQPNVEASPLRFSSELMQLATIVDLPSKAPAKYAR